MLSLPTHLRAAIDAELAQFSTQQLVAAAQELSEFYRSKRNGPFMLSKSHALAYLAVRMPATFAAASAVLTHLPFPITSVLDCGAGPGTLIWALLQHHPMQTATLYEKETVFIEFGKHLTQSLNANVHLDWLKNDVTKISSFAPHELVTLSYVLNELHPQNQCSLIERAWQACSKAVVIIEPGTPEGYQNIIRARNGLIASGATIYAPCPHNLACPMTGNDWCHFAVRLPRTTWHKAIKQADLGYEDEKYSYLIAIRDNIHEGETRIIKNPIKKSGHIILDLCTPEGLKRSIVSKRNKIDYTQAGKAAWGDTWKN